MKPTLPVIVGGGVPTVQGGRIIAVGGTTTFERVGQGNWYGARVIPWDWEDFILGSRLRGTEMARSRLRNFLVLATRGGYDWSSITVMTL